MAEFRESIEIAAPPEAVFDYLTTNEGLNAWLGQHADLDAIPGGRFAVDVAGHPVRGEFVSIERPHRVVVSWGFAGSDDLPAGTSTVEFSLTSTADGSRLDLRHFDLPDLEVRGHAHGWANFMPRLAVVASGGDVAPNDWQPLSG